MVGLGRKLLIVDDDGGLRRQLGWTFEDYNVISAGDRETAIAKFTAEKPAVVTLDLGLPPDEDGASEGLATLSALKSIDPHAKIIVVTGNEDREHALKAISLGAYDYYQKPIDADTIRLIVGRALNLFDLECENRKLREKASHTPLHGVVAASPQMLGVCRTIEKVAPASVTVLLLGESGTGKEVLARALHEMSPRRDKRFVAINCAAIPENLLESELFGHERGAFTGAHKQVTGKVELADEGTLFLDEIGDMPMQLQAKLLRFLQQRVFERVGGRTEIAVNVRVVCATNRDPGELIKTAMFREDLYYRLSELVVHIPALRERQGDVVLLANHFLNQMSKDGRKTITGFSADALQMLAAYRWPGNVRELENRVKRAVIMAETAQVTAADLDLVPGMVAGPVPTTPVPTLTLREVRERAEREAIERVMLEAENNVSLAAKILDISRPTLYSLIRQHNIR